MTVRVAFVRLPHAEGLPAPRRASAGAAGAELVAAVPAAAPLPIPPGGRALVPTGLSMAIPAGYEGQVRPRSGLAARHGVAVLNAPGTVDSDYRGEVMVILANLGDAPFVVSRGERIAQIVISPVLEAEFTAVPDLDGTARGGGGFGSTGR